MALTVNRLGMSLLRMGKPSDDVRFLDDVDLTFSLDNRTTRTSSSQQQMMSIELAMKPLVFRASYRDINMITAIVNKAIELYGASQKPAQPSENDSTSRSLTAQGRTSSTMGGKSRVQPIGKAHVLMSKEQVYRPRSSIDIVS